MMTLKPEMWDSLYTYLVYDRKIDGSNKNIKCHKSIFLILCKYFKEKDFNRENFTKFIQYLIEKGYSKAYANNFIKLAKHIDKYYKFNQLSDFKTFARVPKIVDWLSYEDILKMANVCVKYDPRFDSKAINLKYKCIIMTLLLTGARISEVLNLRWEDLKESPACLVIEQNKTSSMRVAPITKELVVLLQQLPHSSGYIFTNDHGKQIDESTINDELKRRAKLVGIKKRVYNHLLRHSFVNFMLREGTPMHIVSRLVGHKDIATTNEYYTHIMIEELSDFLHAYHPHLRRNQTLASIRMRTQKFLEGFVNKEKFKLDIKQNKGKVNVDIKEI